MMRVPLVFGLLILTLPATTHGGPYCGHAEQFAPAPESTLPVAPTVALFVEDGYYGGARRRMAQIPAVRATIDGKRVALKTRDVRTIDGVIRFFTIASRRTGKLELWQRAHWVEGKTLHVAASYTIVSDWAAPPRASAVVARTNDRRLEPYRLTGHAAALRVNVPAIAFTLRWRRPASDAWVVRPLPAEPVTRERSEASDSALGEARVGQRMCGMIDNVPLPLVESGIEVELTAKLPDGRTVTIGDLPSPLVLPPAQSPPTAAEAPVASD